MGCFLLCVEHVYLIFRLVFLVLAPLRRRGPHHPTRLRQIKCLLEIQPRRFFIPQSKMRFAPVEIGNIIVPFPVNGFIVILNGSLVLANAVWQTSRGPCYCKPWHRWDSNRSTGCKHRIDFFILSLLRQEDIQ